MAHNRLEGMPPDSDRLTENQFVLLGHVLLKSEKDGATMPVIWSPKSFMGGSLTKAEASTVSTRLKTLIKRGFIKRYGRELYITEQGERALRVYATRKKDDDTVAHGISALLDLRQMQRERQALDTALGVMRHREMPPGDKNIVLKQLGEALFDAVEKELYIHVTFMEASGGYDEEKMRVIEQRIANFLQEVSEKPMEKG